MLTAPQRSLKGIQAVACVSTLVLVGALVAMMLVSNSSNAASTVAITTSIQIVSTGTITEAITSTGKVLATKYINSTGLFTVISTVEREAGQVKVGDQVTLTGSGGSSLLPGTVCVVGLTATRSSDLAASLVYIRVAGSPSGLREGASTTMSIIIKQIQGAVIVPTAAIRHNGKGTTVMLDSNGTKVSKKVTTGAVSGTDTQVTTGLTVGENVYMNETTFHAASDERPSRSN